MSSAYEIIAAAKTVDHFSHKAYMFVGLAIDRYLNIQANAFALFVDSEEGYF